MDPEGDREMPRDQPRLQDRARRRLRVDLDPDHQFGASLRGQPHLAQQARELHGGGLNGPRRSQCHLDFMAGPLKISVHEPHPVLEPPVVLRPFQTEVEVLGEPPQSVEETEGRATLKGERREGSGRVDRPEDVRLKVFANEIEARARVVLTGGELEKLLFHRRRSPLRSSSRRLTVRSTALSSLGFAARAANVRSRAVSMPSGSSRSSRTNDTSINPGVR